MAAKRAATAAAGQVPGNVDWMKIEQLYTGTSMKVAVIAEGIGLSAFQLANEAKARGWPLRTAKPVAKSAGSKKPARKKTAPKKKERKKSARAVKPAVAAGSTPPVEDGAHTSKAPTPKPPGLVRSVFKTIEGELRKLDSHQGTTSQDRERASRALSQMVNSLEKAVEMQNKIDKSNAKGSKAKNKEHLAHADDLRRAIAERLERLNSKRDAGKPSATSD